MPDPDPFEPTETVTGYNPVDESRFHKPEEEIEPNFESRTTINTGATDPNSEYLADWEQAHPRDFELLVGEQEPRVDELIEDQGPEIPPDEE